MLTSLDIPAALTLLFLYIIKLILILDILKNILFPLSLLQTATQILTAPVLNHALLFVNKSSSDFKDIHMAFSSAASAFRLKVQTRHTHKIYILRHCLCDTLKQPLVRRRSTLTFCLCARSDPVCVCGRGRAS